jgi:glycosyltransferase involved in cell wall biosynthesis
MDSVELTLALPAYNEGANIELVVRDSAAALAECGLTWELLVIDNCSTDDTASVAERIADGDPRIRVIRHDRNRLYSGSCATAIREARGNLVGIMDSDGQATAADLPRFLAQIESGANLVFGWRRDRKDPGSRLMVSALFNRLGKLYLRYPYHDLNCGFRVFDRSFADVADIQHEINLANPELYVRAVIAELDVAEVEVQHFPRDGGGSSHNFVRSWQLFRDVNRYLRDLRSEMKA